MKLQHKTPCKECPWRKISAPGWLGGHPPEMYADAVAGNETPACHLRDFGPDSPKTAMCAGALAVAANNCIQPYKTSGALKARQIVGKREDCFKSPAEFYSHHAGKPYISFIVRMMENL